MNVWMWYCVIMIADFLLLVCQTLIERMEKKTVNKACKLSIMLKSFIIYVFSRVFMKMSSKTKWRESSLPLKPTFLLFIIFLGVRFNIE